MIPKIIHYCWFGGNPLPELAEKCIASWKKYCPDYEIIEWNESNYDVHKSKFMEQAYERKKWAFVSDYARLDIVYTQGGIYLDTDVEIIRPLDDLLDCEMYAGFEKLAEEKNINYGLGYGAVCGHPYLKEMMDVYNAMDFPQNDKELSKIACSIIQTEVLMRHGLIPDDQKQTLEKCEIFDHAYFSPKDFHSGKLLVTPETYSIHHYDMSWFAKEHAAMRQKEWEMNRKYKSKKVIKLIMFPQKLRMHYAEGGIKGLKEYFSILFENWYTRK